DEQHGGEEGRHGEEARLERDTAAQGVQGEGGAERLVREDALVGVVDVEVARASPTLTSRRPPSAIRSAASERTSTENTPRSHEKSRRSAGGDAAEGLAGGRRRRRGLDVGGVERTGRDDTTRTPAWRPRGLCPGGAVSPVQCGTRCSVHACVGRERAGVGARRAARLDLAG